MTPFLLDVNVLISLVRPKHSAHEKVMQWFRSDGRTQWATCAFTEAGLIRVVSNPRFSAQAITVGEALQLLFELTALPGHQFWSLGFGFVEAVKPIQERFLGHQQATDAYLLALAIKNQGKLVTQDRGLLYLAGEEFAEHLLLL